MSNEKAEIMVSEASVFALFDKLDDAVIAAEIEGKLVNECVYHFAPAGGKEVWGIGKKGVDLCIQEMAKKGMAVRDDDVTWTVDPMDPEYMLFKAHVRRIFVKNPASGGGEAEVDTAIGLKRQWTKMQRRDKSIVADPFWFEKGGQKAIRNARLRLIPEEIQSTIIAFAKKEGRVKEISEREVHETAGQNGASQTNPKASIKQIEFFDKLYSGLKKHGLDDAIIREEIRKGYEAKFNAKLPDKIPADLTISQASAVIDHLKGWLDEVGRASKQ